MLHSLAARDCPCELTGECHNNLNQYYLAADIISHYCGGPWTKSLAWFHWDTYPGYRELDTWQSYEGENPQEVSVQPTRLRRGRQQPPISEPVTTRVSHVGPITAYRLLTVTVNFRGRLRIRLAISGRTVCFPGPATFENGWSIPSHVFYVRDLTGQHVRLVDEDGITLTDGSHLVAAVHTQGGEVAPGSFMLSETAVNGWVLITLGETVTPFTGLAWEERPREDGSDVPTPPTPRSIGYDTPGWYF